MTRAIDSTLLWAARIVGLLILVALVVVAFKVLVAAVVVPVLFVGMVVAGVALVRRRRARHAGV